MSQAKEEHKRQIIIQGHSVYYINMNKEHWEPSFIQSITDSLKQTSVGEMKSYTWELEKFHAGDDP